MRRSVRSAPTVVGPVMGMAMMIFGGEIGVVVVIRMVAGQNRILPCKQGESDDAEFGCPFHDVFL